MVLLMLSGIASGQAQSPFTLEDDGLGIQSLRCGQLLVNGGDFEICCQDSTPGVLRSRKGSTTFISTTTLKRNAKRKGITSRLRKWRKIHVAGQSFCQEQPDVPPSPTPTPTPTPSLPPSPFKNFDANGNVSSVGKECFQIPSHLNADITSGASEAISQCSGCHGVNLNIPAGAILASQKFQYMRERLKLEPMYLDESNISDASLANITAYLNRFNLNTCP
ncbi:MAG: hypothetical protein KDD60_10850 [Bdellovibrionales bacterium]|nr:hypothetical protein [Bdellovibrionales bacterium]